MALSEQDYNDQIDKLLLEYSNTESKVGSSDGDTSEFRTVSSIKEQLRQVRIEKAKAYPTTNKGRNRSFRQLGRRGL